MFTHIESHFFWGTEAKVSYELWKWHGYLHVGGTAVPISMWQKQDLTARYGKIDNQTANIAQVTDLALSTFVIRPSIIGHQVSGRNIV